MVALEAQVKLKLNDFAGAEADWRAMQYMVAEVYYGGAITDEWDVRIIRALAAERRVVQDPASQTFDIFSQVLSGRRSNAAFRPRQTAQR